jgi:hypothetical protein
VCRECRKVVQHWCTLMGNHIIRTSPFDKNKIKDLIYQNVLRHYVLPHIYGIKLDTVMPVIL